MAQLIVVLVTGLLFRCWMLWNGVDDILREQPELVTPYSSLERIGEASFLQDVELNQYDGYLYYRIPIVLQGFRLLPKDLWGLFLVFIDVFNAILLYLTAVALSKQTSGEENNALEKQLYSTTKIDDKSGTNQWDNYDFLNSIIVTPAQGALFAAGAYFLNPYIILCCIGGNITCLTLFFSLVALYESMNGRFLTASIAACAAAWMDIYCLLLIVPVSIQLFRGGSLVRSLISVICFAVLWISVLSTSEIQLVVQGYFRIFQNHDLSPNIGLRWYFFIEMFAAVLPLFLFLSNVVPLLYILPMMVSLSHRPQVLGHMMLLIFFTQGPYPDFFGIGVLAPILCLHPYSLRRMWNVPLACVCILGTTCLLPVMRTMWLVEGSGNANYYYFQTLFLQFAIAYLLLEFYRAVRSRDFHLNHYFLIHANANKKEN